MSDKDLEKQTPTGALAEISPEEQALADQVKGSVDRSKLLLPALKLGHALTDEVQDEDSEVTQGDFFNSITGAIYGKDLELVIASHFEGRFYSDGDGNSFATQADVAPDYWPEEYAGKAFVDIPDSEERWKVDVNNGDHDWGHGPPISTTQNFVGFVVDDDSGLPVRLSLMRTSNYAANKLLTFIASARTPWDRTYRISSKREVKNEKPYLVVEAAQAGITGDELRQRAVTLAGDFLRAQEAGNVELAGDEPEADAKPKRGAAKGRDGGLKVS